MPTKKGDRKTDKRLVFCHRHMTKSQFLTIINIEGRNFGITDYCCHQAQFFSRKSFVGRWKKVSSNIAFSLHESFCS